MDSDMYEDAAKPCIWDDVVAKKTIRNNPTASNTQEFHYSVAIISRVLSILHQELIAYDIWAEISRWELIYIYTYIYLHSWINRIEHV